MPAALSYPGVYIQEIPSAAHTIGPVSTSVAAFVDCFKWGPTNTPVQLLGMADLDRLFGGLDARSESSYAIQQFFLNGGSAAWVVRVVKNATCADITILDGTADGAAALVVTAVNEGTWANRVRVRIDNAASSDTEFDLTASLYGTDSRGRDTVVKQEVFRSLSMDSTDSNFVQRIVNDPATGSALVRVDVAPGATKLPLANGAVSAAVSSPVPVTQKVTVAIGGSSAVSRTFSLTLSATSAVADIALALETAIRRAAEGDARLATATVTVAGGRLQVRLGSAKPSDVLTISGAGGLGFSNGAAFNSQEYALGGSSIAGTAQGAGERGADGDLPDASALMGNSADKSGIYALDGVDLFNLLCIPRTAIARSTPVANELSYDDADQVMTLAISYAASRRAMFLMDPPIGLDSPTQLKSWMAAHGDKLRDANAALFYPRLMIVDPLDGSRLRSFGPSGTMAGLFASIDLSRGVWKAPAGSEASLRNVAALGYELTDAENGTLNPLAVNCLRVFPVYGAVSWGARTLKGADIQGSEWKYIPVRRLALYIEESLFRGTKWVVFEPNDESLWGQIRMNLDAFMHNLFRLGAFQGQTPREAYFVKCDRETNPQSQIDMGIVNVVVGFAPLKPAEFVVIQIQQIAGGTGA